MSGEAVGGGKWRERDRGDAGLVGQAEAEGLGVLVDVGGDEVGALGREDVEAGGGKAGGKEVALVAEGVAERVGGDGEGGRGGVLERGAAGEGEELLDVA